jgi:uncharacterized protein with PQ loop repeat
MPFLPAELPSGLSMASSRNGPLIIANAITVALSGLILQRKLENHLTEKGNQDP